MTTLSNPCADWAAEELELAMSYQFHLSSTGSQTVIVFSNRGQYLRRSPYHRLASAALWLNQAAAPTKD